MMARTMARPKPLPLFLRLIASRPRSNCSKIMRCSSPGLLQQLESRHLLAATALPDSYDITNNNQSPVSIDTLQPEGFRSVLENDSSDNGEPLTATLLDEPENGSLEFNSDGSFVYTPDLGFVGEDSFTYEANDGDDPATATVTLNVQSETRLLASGDAWARETGQSTNYGGWSTSQVSDDDDGEDDFNFTYLKFDVSEISGSIAEAVFEFSIISTPSATISLYEVTEDWDEFALTYSNRPSTGAFLGSVPIDATKARWSIDLTSHIQAAIDNDVSVVSWVMRSNRVHDTTIATSEHTNEAFRPELRITNADNRPPATNDDSYETVQWWQRVPCRKWIACRSTECTRE